MNIEEFIDAVREHDQAASNLTAAMTHTIRTQSKAKALERSCVKLFRLVVGRKPNAGELAAMLAG